MEIWKRRKRRLFMLEVRGGKKGEYNDTADEFSSKLIAFMKIRSILSYILV